MQVNAVLGLQETTTDLRSGNKSSEMQYLNDLFDKWMPRGQKLAVDSDPSIHEVHDLVNAASATPKPLELLPAEFYDRKALKIMEQISAEEEYGGFIHDAEYRTLGIGQPLNEAVERMTQRTLQNKPLSNLSRTSESGQLSASKSSSEIAKFSLFACHDSTIGGIMTSLGIMKAPNLFWPPYASFLTIEMFRPRTAPQRPTAGTTNTKNIIESQRYVRLSYRNRPLEIPACASPGDHLAGDKSFCTLVEFNGAPQMPRDPLTLTGCFQASCRKF